MAGPMTGGEGPAEPGPVIRDRRRLDPQTGQVRERYGATGAPKPKGKHVSNGAPDAGSKSPGAAAGKGGRAGSAGDGTPADESPEAPATPAESTEPAEPSAAERAAETAGKHADVQPEDRPAGEPDGAKAGEGQPEPVAKPDPGAPAPDPAAQAVAAAEAAAAAALASATSASAPADVTGDVSAELAQARAEAEERLGDLQRLQAEYVNYRRRVERDRTLARDFAVAGVLETLLPVLDDVHLARQHGDLEAGPFAAIAEKLETVLARHGLERYGEPGEEFDPSIHEALMHTEAELAEGTTATTVVQVLQPGYKAGDRVLRPARVAVADPPA
jgi:molecular chaperone GrpE